MRISPENRVVAYYARPALKVLLPCVHDVFKPCRTPHCKLQPRVDLHPAGNVARARAPAASGIESQPSNPCQGSPVCTCCPRTWTHAQNAAAKPHSVALHGVTQHVDLYSAGCPWRAGIHRALEVPLDAPPKVPEHGGAALHARMLRTSGCAATAVPRTHGHAGELLAGVGLCGSCIKLARCRMLQGPRGLAACTI